ncbi:uncharacterized protein LOC121735975 [Aricia agestis]|uniref:uncharacterized protein LOC121735975 n=1 Tax=Aricia agestis TaxID=91739 RepID=UPI001C208525|nr:uncharacterized protein LOC121735975 [Aricia agestis]
MTLLLVLLLSLGATLAQNTTECDGLKANFDLKKVIGAWYVVAIIPGKQFPERQKEVTCFKMELSETDEAGLRWLMNKELGLHESSMDGTVIRQRYHSEHPFDIWSRSTGNGCFRQVLSLDTNHTQIGEALSHNATMQLHLIETKEDGVFLIQILWGKMVSAVIYRPQMEVTQDQLKPAYNFMTGLRGTQRLPIICDNTLRSILHVN